MEMLSTTPAGPPFASAVARPSVPPKNVMPAVAQISARTPSAIIAPKKTFLPSDSFLTVLAIIGLCVEWNPEKAPHDMVIMSSGQTGSVSGCALRSEERRVGKAGSGEAETRHRQREERNAHVR